MFLTDKYFLAERGPRYLRNLQQVQLVVIDVLLAVWFSWWVVVAVLFIPSQVITFKSNWVVLWLWFASFAFICNLYFAEPVAGGPLFCNKILVTHLQTKVKTSNSINSNSYSRNSDSVFIITVFITTAAPKHHHWATSSRPCSFNNVYLLQSCQGPHPQPGDCHVSDWSHVSL